MTHGSFRLAAIALGATALASLIPLWAGAATTEMRQHESAGAAVHQSAGGGAHQMRTRNTVHATATVRSNVRVNARVNVTNRRYGHTRRYGYAAGGVVGGPAYGVRYAAGGGHGCSWYYHYQPNNVPAGCGARSGPVHGAIIGHGYHGRYASGNSTRYRVGVSERGRIASHGVARPVEGRAANVNVHVHGGVQTSVGATEKMHGGGGGQAHRDKRMTH